MRFQQKILTAAMASKWARCILSLAFLACAASSDSAHRALTEGVQQFNQGDLTGAAASYQRAIDLEPRSWPVAYFNLGMAQLQSKTYRAALKSLRIASRLSPDDPDPRQHASIAARDLCRSETAQATQLAAQGAMQQAEEQLISVARLVRQCAPALEVLGPLFLMRGKANHALGGQICQAHSTN